MKLVETSPTPCLCGRTSSPVWLETEYEVPGLRGWVHWCLDCLIEIQSHVRSMPMAEHERIVAGFNANAAQMQDRINRLTKLEVEAGQLREELDGIRPQLEQHNAHVLGLEQTIAEEQRKREEAERRAAGNITIRGFEDSIARAVEKGWADNQPKRKPPKREPVAA